MNDKYLKDQLFFLRDERGATAVEYSVMLVLIILVCLVTVGYLGKATEGSFNKFSSTYNSAVAN